MVHGQNEIYDGDSPVLQEDYTNADEDRYQAHYIVSIELP